MVFEGEMPRDSVLLTAIRSPCGRTVEPVEPERLTDFSHKDPCLHSRRPCVLHSGGMGNSRPELLQRSGVWSPSQQSAPPALPRGLAHP